MLSARLTSSRLASRKSLRSLFLCTTNRPRGMRPLAAVHTRSFTGLQSFRLLPVSETFRSSVPSFVTCSEPTGTHVLTGLWPFLKRVARDPGGSCRFPLFQGAAPFLK